MPLQPAEAAVELGHVDVIPGSNLAFTSVSDVNVAGMTKTVTVGNRPIVARVELEMQNAQTATVYGVVKLWEDNVLVATWRTTSSTAQFQFLSFSRSVRLAPTPGEHTYRVTLALNNATLRELQILAATRNSLSLVQQ